ncbi:hypothetical protein F4861DRAFT_99159 [Xylaria intraflava]|nr:hypothetical protein F4861DRAFT_99159 [Xylaria intraflava]
MAPAAEYIRSLIQQNSAVALAQSPQPGSILKLGGLKDILAADVRIEFPGLDVEIHGADKLDADVVHPQIPPLVNVLDVSKPIESLPPQVYVGSDDSVVLIVTNKATAVSGKPFNNTTVAVLHFDSSEKIDHITAYVDTKHISEIFAEAVSK